MPAARKVIALAGAGDLGKYICEELTADERFDVVVISRGVNSPISSLTTFRTWYPSSKQTMWEDEY